MNDVVVTVQKVYSEPFDIETKGNDFICKIRGEQGWNFLTISKVSDRFRVGSRGDGFVCQNLETGLRKLKYPSLPLYK